MHPYVKQQLPCQVLCFILILSVAACSVGTQSCNSGVRTVSVWSEAANGYVRVEGKRVIAKPYTNTNSTTHYLQKVTIDRHLYLLFDLDAKMFICWNKKFTNLVARRNPKDLKYCKFEDKVSFIHSGTHMRYMTTYRLRNDSPPRVNEIRFNSNGHFMNRNSIRKCVTNRKKKGQLKTVNLNAMATLLNPLYIPEDQKSYSKISVHCGSPDFLEDPKNCSLGQRFCPHVRKVHQSSHAVPCELMTLCAIKDVESKCSRQNAVNFS